MKSQTKKILIACESSGTVREAFRDLGHDAWSCDLLPVDDGSPCHIQGDAIQAIKSRHWDLVIGHPPCTYLTHSAEWAYGPGPYHQKTKPGTLVGQARVEARNDAVEFFWEMWCAAARIGAKVALENPVGAINAMQKPDQIIQPYDFGDDASKKTCLWVHGLPLLKPTGRVEPRMVGGKPRWGNQTDSGQNRLAPGSDRWKKRSKTFRGIALAMADQWGKAL